MMVISFMILSNSCPSSCTHFVRLPHEAGEGVGVHLLRIAVHVELNRFVLVLVEMEVANVPKDPHRTATVPVDVASGIAMRGA